MVYLWKKYELGQSPFRAKNNYSHKSYCIIKYYNVSIKSKKVFRIKVKKFRPDLINRAIKSGNRTLGGRRVGCTDGRLVDGRSRGVCKPNRDITRNWNSSKNLRRKTIFGLRKVFENILYFLKYRKFSNKNMDKHRSRFYISVERFLYYIISSICRKKLQFCKLVFGLHAALIASCVVKEPTKMDTCLDLMWRDSVAASDLAHRFLRPASAGAEAWSWELNVKRFCVNFWDFDLLGCSTLWYHLGISGSGHRDRAFPIFRVTNLRQI